MILRINVSETDGINMFSDYIFVPKKVIFRIIEEIDEIYEFIENEKKWSDDPAVHELDWRIKILSDYVDLLK